ncbi:hypothetical protein Dsin_007299 [Dipteronia sinensis]|uniref:Uncharacterized protein n=1 Tax=Dipteronia sinensis TaxID=43782 RepID=A0AAE0EGY9_9ROSI|nr:hypothetical protein Dsin_007299 [Dipteronia sinensis]
MGGLEKASFDSDSPTSSSSDQGFAPTMLSNGTGCRGENSKIGKMRRSSGSAPFTQTIMGLEPSQLVVHLGPIQNSFGSLLLGQDSDPLITSSKKGAKLLGCGSMEDEELDFINGSMAMCDVVLDKVTTGSPSDKIKKGETMFGQSSDAGGKDDIPPSPNVTMLKRKGRKNVSSLKVHGMRTRLSSNIVEQKQDQSGTDIDIVDVEGNKLSWSVEEEIAKVIENGVAIGRLKTRSKSKFGEKEHDLDDANNTTIDAGDNKILWCLEEEIVKVIKTGVALGIDFGGNQKDIMEEISRRELEDTARVSDTAIV